MRALIKLFVAIVTIVATSLNVVAEDKPIFETDRIFLALDNTDRCSDIYNASRDVQGNDVTITIYNHDMCVEKQFTIPNSYTKRK